MSKRLQILFLPKWYPNELEAFDGNFIKNYAEAIQLNCDVKVVFVHSKANINEKFQITTNVSNNLEEAIVYFKKSTIPLFGKLINTIRYIKAQNKGFQRLSSQTVDVSHIHILTRSSFLALSLKRRLNAPIVISEHWTGYHKENGLYKGWLKKKLTEYVVNNTNIIHVVSKQLQYSMEAVGLKGKYHSIGNVVNTELFKPTPHTNKVLRIIYVGNLIQRHKRILDIIQTIGELSIQRENFELVIYGEGEQEEDCRQLIEGNGWNNRIFLKGTLDRQGIAKAMAESDFLILFSETENQPCVINEAQACGLPVVVPDIPGIEERMNEKLGIVFPTGNKEEFSQALNNMLNYHHQYDAQYIRSFAEREYSEPTIAKKFESLYLDAIATHQQ